MKSESRKKKIQWGKLSPDPLFSFGLSSYLLGTEEKRTLHICWRHCSSSRISSHLKDYWNWKYNWNKSSEVILILRIFSTSNHYKCVGKQTWKWLTVSNKNSRSTRFGTASKQRITHVFFERVKYFRKFFRNSTCRKNIISGMDVQLCKMRISVFCELFLLWKGK